MHTPRLKSLDTSPLQPCVLLTGFDAFAGAAVNPSWLAVQMLDGENIHGHVLVAAQLPTVFGSAAQVLARLLKRHTPALVICTGQAAGRGALSIERIAVNVNDARIADNSGNQPIDTPVVPGGPAAYFSTLPIKAMRRAIEQGGVAAEVSQTAGTFVCNHVFYSLMHALATQDALKKTRGGFVHVPNLPTQGLPSMALDEMAQGLHLAIACALTTSADITTSAGALS
ncbi:MAG: pyroglutamyl-peptidase I [Polaromonas sp.]|nr:MAG: pyroglutamyl-peptidase I [Polaromonas sp.]